MSSKVPTLERLHVIKKELIIFPFIFWSPSLFSQQIDKSLNIHLVLNIGLKEKKSNEVIEKNAFFDGSVQ